LRRALLYQVSLLERRAPTIVARAREAAALCET
jgi:hypothetical protein